MDAIELAQHDCNRRNTETSRREVAEFIANPPLKYFAYVNLKNATLTTWMGDKLGDIQLGAQYYARRYGVSPVQSRRKGGNHE